MLPVAVRDSFKRPGYIEVLIWASGEAASRGTRGPLEVLTVAVGLAQKSGLN